VALAITALDVHFSRQLGLLAHPPYYDGIAYLVDAKSLFYQLKQWWVHPRSLMYALVGNRVALWQALMLLNFLVLGEGEWQAYATRFWPTFLLLLLIMWVIRRRGDARMAVTAVVFTSLLPTISVGLRSSTWEYFTGRVTFGLEWYLADLRPDLLFAVLLLWAVVPLIEHACNLDRRTLLVSGVSAGLALLAKPSASPMLLLAWGLGISYVLVVRWRKLQSTILLICLWTLLPFGIMVSPWALAGGAKWVVEYYHQNLIVGRNIYSNPHATLLSEATYYWKLFQFHMGHAEGWVGLGVGLLALAITWRRTGHIDKRLLSYLALSAVLYGLVSATPNKNFFVGLPYYLLLWLFSWAALATIVKTWIHSNRNRTVIWILPLVLCLYVGAIIGGGFYALQNWPVEERGVGPGNRAVTLQIAQDLKGILVASDCFTYLPAFGYPAALQYYMMDMEGATPESTPIDVFTPMTTAQFIENEVSRCKAILVYLEDVQEVSEFFFVPPVRWPYLRAIAEWVRMPDNGYAIYKTYYISVAPFSRSYQLGENDRRTFTIQLYIKQHVDGGGE